MSETTTTTTTATLTSERVADIAKRFKGAAKSLTTGEQKFDSIVTEVREAQVWTATGHKGMAEYVAATLDVSVLGKAALDVIIVQCAMSDPKMSGRKIADALGVDQKRVSRAISAAKSDGTLAENTGGNGGGNGGSAAATEHDKAMAALRKVAETVAALDLSGLTVAEIDALATTYGEIVNGNLTRFGNALGAARKTAKVDQPAAA